MKRQLFALVPALLFALTAIADTNIELLQELKQHADAGIVFTENKGQVHDQNYRPRPDVLYNVMTGNMAVHIKKNGVSYQLYRTDTYKEVEDLETRKTKRQADRWSIYRIDMVWLDHNPGFTRTEESALPGYNNYYLESCPGGALNVKSFKSITLNSLYKGIDLHYYEKNGELKHDYIVAPHANYKQIRLQVKGADIRLDPDGSLLLGTPLGNVQEGAPLVFQNGKQLKARWQIKNNVLSFEIENYNPAYELIIDPITRLWGTFYGGAGDDAVNSCATDASGNVYLAGTTDSNISSFIATTGSHQTSYGGGFCDAFLVKMDPGGTRLWGTYYGGAGDELGRDCAADISGDVYLSGYTTSTTNVISTPGCHQLFMSGYMDAMLVKFNSNGVRQWGTYYGGSGSEYGHSCSTDASGNVFLAGISTSPGSANTAVATTGAHQTSNGSSPGAFVVKFNTSGARQWGTYYGAMDTYCFSSAVDGNGNVYLAGMTNLANTNGIISTFGGHQPVYGGGQFDAFLVKFNTSGVRQWATYYGGTGDDYGYCGVDAIGNVYLTGSTSSTASANSIATNGSHQTTFGGVYDAYLAKFNPNGVRQWATYYGGTGDESAISCAADGVGNVYMAGSTGTSAGTAIATPGSQQPAFSGAAYDAFLVKFDAGGIRQSGTYYGGTGIDNAKACAVDVYGSAYLAGETGFATGSFIASPGSYQSSFAGGSWDGFLAKFDACDVAPAQPSVISPASACTGYTASYSTPATAGANTYTWMLPGGWSGASSTNSIIAAPGASGIFTVTAGNLCGVSPQQTLSVTVFVPPVVSINSGSICLGQSFTLAANGASTYTYSSGPVVAPSATSVYSVTGTSTAGCISSNTGTVTVIALPPVILNTGAICAGESFTLMATGASSYTYSAGPVVSPATTSFYSVIGTSAEGCTNTAVTNVIVNQLPVITISTTNTVLCAGEETTISANGASVYTFNPGGIGPDIIVSPTVTTTYTVTGIDNNGCKNTSVFTQNVDVCTGLKENAVAGSGIRLYPNPTPGQVQLEIDAEQEIFVVNALGQTVYFARLVPGKHTIHFEDLANGVYVLKIRNAEGVKTFKVVKE